MTRLFSAITLFFLFASAAALRAQDEDLAAGPPMQLSLDDAIEYALRHNDSLKNSRIGVALQKQRNREITGIALPQINGRNEFQHYPNPIQSFLPALLIPPAFGGGGDGFVAVPFTPRFSNTANVSGSQVLFDGSVVVALQARNTIIYLTELGVQATEQDVRYNVTRAYYGLTVARRQFAILSQSLVTFRDALRDLSILREQGFVEKIEVDRTQVQVNNLQTDSLRAYNGLLLAEQLLKFNMSLSLDQPIVLTDTAINDVLAQSAGLLEGDMRYENRVDYAFLQTQLRLNEFDVKRYKFKALPSLAAFGTLAYTYSSNEFREVATPHNYIFYSLVGLRLDVPIFTGFQRKAQLEQAYLNVQRTRNNIALLKRGIDLQTSQARTGLRNALLALQTTERNLGLAQSVVDLARKKYKAGVGSNLEVTQAQSELLQAQNRLFTAQLDVINANTDLQRAQGLFR